MKIYGQTEKIIVREMTENDCEKFLELMIEHGTNGDFTVEDMQILWKFRNRKGDLQCTITSMDGKTIYGFCGILHTKPKETKVCADVFAEFSDTVYEEQARTIIEHLR